MKYHNQQFTIHKTMGDKITLVEHFY